MHNRAVDDGTLVQKYLLSRRTYRLGEDAVSVEESGPLAKKKFVILYESVPRDAVEVTFRSRGWRALLYVAIVIFGSTVFAANNDLLKEPVALFWGLILIATAIRYLTSKATYLVFHSETPALVFQKDRPTEEAVSAFIVALQERKASHLRERFLDGSGSTPASEIHKLAWLKQQGAISDDEFARLKRSVIESTTPAPEEPNPDTVH